MSDRDHETRVESGTVDLDRRTIEARDAATGELVREVIAAAPEEVRDAVRRARTAQRDWGARPVTERARALAPLLDRLLARRDDLARLVARESGRPRVEALLGEVLPALGALDFCLKNAPRIFASERLHHRLWKLSRTTTLREPWGTVGILTGASDPFFVPASIAFSALVAGNAVVLKPSEHAPLAALELESLLRTTSVPPALYHVMPGDASVGAALVDAGCQRIVFTGTAEAGSRVAAACGERLVPCLLDVGGKSAAIVLEDADLERAARVLAWGAFSNAGQARASVGRVLVKQEVAQSFAEKLLAEASKLRTGADRSFESDVGALATRVRWELARRHVDDAKARGALVLAGGHGREGEGDKGGFFFEPTILANVQPGSLVLDEETAGPIVAIVAVSGEEEAVRLANEHRDGLAASVWTRDARAADRISKRLEVGTVWVNDALGPSSAGEASWGGTKRSGFGRTRGELGLLEMTRPKHVARDRGLLARSPLGFPYSRDRYEAASAVLPALFMRGAPLAAVGTVARAARAFLERRRPVQPS